MTRIGIGGSADTFEFTGTEWQTVCGTDNLVIIDAADSLDA